MAVLAHTQTLDVVLHGFYGMCLVKLAGACTQAILFEQLLIARGFFLRLCAYSTLYTVYI